MPPRDPNPLKISRKVRDYANDVALDAFPNDVVAWTTKAHIKQLRRHVRDAYLRGYLDAKVEMLEEEVETGIHPEDEDES